MSGEFRNMHEDWIAGAEYRGEVPITSDVFAQLKIEPPTEDNPDAYNQFLIKLYSIPTSEAYRRLDEAQRIPIFVSVTTMLSRMGVNQTVIYDILCGPMA